MPNQVSFIAKLSNDELGRFIVRKYVIHIAHGS